MELQLREDMAIPYLKKEEEALWELFQQMQFILQLEE